MGGIGKFPRNKCAFASRPLLSSSHNQLMCGVLPGSFLIKIICARNDFIVCHFFFEKLDSLKRVKKKYSFKRPRFGLICPRSVFTHPQSFLMYQSRQQTSSFKESFLVNFHPFEKMKRTHTIRETKICRRMSSHSRSCCRNVSENHLVKHISA